MSYRACIFLLHKKILSAPQKTTPHLFEIQEISHSLESLLDGQLLAIQESTKLSTEESLEQCLDSQFELVKSSHTFSLNLFLKSIGISEEVAAEFSLCHFDSVTTQFTLPFIKSFDPLVRPHSISPQDVSEFCQQSFRNLLDQNTTLENQHKDTISNALAQISETLHSRLAIAAIQTKILIFEKTPHPTKETEETQHASNTAIGTIQNLTRVGVLYLIHTYATEAWHNEENKDGIIQSKIGTILTGKNPELIKTFLQRSDIRSPQQVQDLTRGLGTGFLDTEGPAHATQRTLLYSHLSGKTIIENLTQKIQEMAKVLFFDLKERIDKALETGTSITININELAQLFTSRAIAIPLGLDPSGITQETASAQYNAFSEILSYVTDTRSGNLFVQAILPKRLCEFFNFKSIGTLRERFLESNMRYLSEGKYDPKNPQGFIKVATETYRNEGSEDIRENPDIQAHIYPTAAGTDTTVGTMLWTLTFLIENPLEIQQILQESGKINCFSANPRELKEQTLHLQKSIKEALRLRPPAPLIARIASEDMTLGETQIRRGTTVFIPILANQLNDPQYAHPTTFNPSRHSKPEPFATEMPHYTPFGMGSAHSCIGKWFATEEIKIFMLSLLQLMDLYTVTPASELVQTSKPMGTLSPKEPIVLIFSKK